VTVIVPMHNRAETIGDTLDSLAAQTRLAARIIVVDDASTDNSVAVARQHEAPNLEVLELKKNLGVGGARNAAARLATTTWLAFVDADDTWEPTFLEAVVGAAETFNADFASSGGERDMVRRPTSVRLLKAPPEAADRTVEFWRIARRFMPIVPTAAVIRRTKFLKEGGFEDDVRWGEEVPLFARLWLNGPFALVNQPLWKSTQVPTGMSAVRRSYRDTALHLARLGKVLLKAIARRKPGTRAFVGTYLRRVYRKHRNWFGGVLRSYRRRLTAKPA